VHILWLLLAPLGIKGYYYLTWRLLWRILTVDINEEKNIYYLVHKTFVLQYCLKKRRIVHGEANDLKIYDVLYQGKLKKMAKDLEINFEEICKGKEKILFCIKAICLRITKKLPQSMLAQMNLAYIYSKFDSLYLISNTLIQAISAQDPSYQAQISISLLRVDLQRRLALQFSDQGLNIENYIINQEVSNQFKREIDKQVNFQLEFWKGFVAIKPHMLRLLKISWRVNRQKGIVRKLWGNLLKIRPNTLIGPMIVYGMYASLANNNTIEGEKYLEYSNEETKRLRKVMKVDELNNNTLFYEKTVQITMSGLKSKLGRILYTSENIGQVFGWQSSDTIEKPINFLMTQFYAKRHDKFLKIHYKTGKVVVLNNTNLVPVKTANGYIRPSWMHVKVNPFVELGISYIALLRPSRSEKRMVLVTKDGKIDGMSREFAKEMNIDSGKASGEWNILMFCPELRAVNKAFNSVAESMMLTAENDGNNSSIIETGTATATARNMNTSVFDKSIGENTSRITERPLLQKGDSSNNNDSAIKSKKSSPEPIAIHHIKKNYQEIKAFTSLELKADVETSPKSQENTQAVYEKFSTQGAKLVFYPRKAYETTGNKISLFNRSSQSEGQSEAIAYNVQIMNRIYDKEVIKVLVLEKMGENNYETDAEMKSSNPNHTPKSTNKVKVEYVEDLKKPRLSFQDEIISPQFPSVEANKRSSLGVYDVTNGEKRRSGEAGISLSILDEIQSDDSQAKKAIPRKIIGERAGASPRRDLNLENQMKQNSRFSQLTDEFELSFNQNMDRQGEESPKIWTLNSVTRRSAIDFSQQQFLNILEGNRGSVPKQGHGHKEEQQTIVNPVVNFNRGSLFFPADQQQEFPKEEKLLKTKLRKLKERLHEVVMHNAPKAEGVANSVASTYLSKGKKVQSLLLQALRIGGKKKSGRIYSYIFGLFVLVMLIFLALQTVNLYKGIWKVEDQLPVISAASDRENSVMYSYGVTRMWKSRIQDEYSIAGWLYDNAMWKVYLQGVTEFLREQNNYLWDIMTAMPMDTQEKFYEKSIKIYGGDNEVLAMVSSYEMIREIIENQIRCENIQIPFNYSADIDTSSFDFVLENSLNSLLISSEELISEMSEELRQSNNSTRTSIKGTLAGLLVVAFVFLLLTVKYFLVIRAEAARFMMLFFRIKEKEGIATQLILQRFKIALQTNLKDFELPKEEETRSKIENNKENSSSIKFRTASMSSLYTAQGRVFLKLVPNYLLFICWSVTYFFLTLEFIQGVQSSEVQMQTALEASRNRTLLSIELLDLPLSNGTGYVKNTPFLDDLETNLKCVQNSDDLVSQFRDHNGNLSPLQEEILFGFPCKNLKQIDYEAYQAYYASCLAVANGKEILGLLNLNAQLYDLGTQMVDAFYSSNRTQEELGLMFEEDFAMTFALMNITQGYLNMLYESTYQKFQDEINNIEKLTWVFSLIILMATLITTCLTWKKVVKEIFELQKIDKYMLQLVPLKIILGNKHLQQYILKNRTSSNNGILDEFGG